MTKFNVAQTSFSRGMLSKRLIGATDLEDYFQGAEEIDNFIVMPQGGLKKRPGTKYITTVDVPDNVTDFYRPQLAYFYDQVYPTMFVSYRGLGVKPYYYGDNSFGSFLDPAPAQGGDFFLHRYQSVKFGDTMVLVSEDGQEPRTITRFPEGDFGGVPAFTVNTWFTDFFTSDSEQLKWYYKTPYSENLGACLTTAETSGFFTLEFDTSLGPTGTDLNIPVRFEVGTSTTFAVILRKTTGQTVFDNIYLCYKLQGADPGAALHSNIRISVWNATDGFPKSSTAFQQRSVFGGTAAKPDTLFGSAVSDQNVFITPHLVEDADADVSVVATTYGIRGSIANTDPYVFNIASQYDTQIKWVSGGNVLYAGKLDEERVATGYDDALGPLSVSIQKKSSIGGGGQHSVAVDRGVFFITSDAKSVGFLVFNERNGQSTSIGTETTAYGIVEEQGQYVYIKKLVGDIKNSLVYAHLSNGTLIAIAFNDAVNNFAWSKLDFAFEVVDIEYAVHVNELHLLCKYADSDVITLESLELKSDFQEHFTNGTDNYAVTLDGATVYDYGSALSGTVTGFERYADKTVIMLSPEGGEQEVTVNSAGEIELPQEVTKYQIGTLVSARVRSMRISGGAEYGNTNGRPKRVDTLTVDVLNSYGGKWTSIDRNNRYELFKYADASQFTGQLKIKPDTSFSETPQIEVTHDTSYPFILLNMVFKGVTYYD